MGDPAAPALQPAELVRLLDRQGVRYVVVGGLAATVHGATRVTFDIDLVPEWTDDNLERLARALQDAGAELQAPDAPPPVAFPIDARSLRRFEVSTWRTRLGDLDVVIGTPTAKRGVLAGYDALAPKALEREAFGVTILVADLDDVIESKQALGREPDLVALPELHRLRESQRRSSG
jgi:hypothetical protein